MMVYKLSLKFIVCIICNILLVNVFYFAYKDVTRKKEIIETQKPIRVEILDINRGRSRANCTVKFNNKVYDNISLPSRIKKGDINNTDFYYDNNKNEIISNNIGENALKGIFVLFIISLLLWFAPKKYFKF